MFFRTLALLCVLPLVVGSGCLLDDKQVGGDELEPDPPDPRERYCDRAAACLDEDESLCEQECPEQSVDPSCRDALLSVQTCLEASACEGGTAAQDCAAALEARAESCGT